MTVPYWGKITPSQGFMLMLAGHVLHGRTACRGEADPGAASDDHRLESMRAGRDRLRRLTGRDCGYDLERWHALLLEDAGDEWGYRHPYAWQTVRPAIEGAINDPDRLRRVGLLEGSPPADPTEGR